MKETLHVSGRYPSEVDVAVLFLFLHVRNKLLDLLNKSAKLVHHAFIYIKMVHVSIIRMM